MVDPLGFVAIGLAAIAVLGAVLPVLPSSVFSIAGVIVYWWQTGYTEPGTVVLIGLLGLGAFSLVVEYAGGAVSAKAGGAATSTVALAAVVGVVALLITGPIGLLVAVAGVVFAGEFYRNRNARQGARAALYATIGVLASSIVQALLAGTILVALSVVAFF